MRRADRLMSIFHILRGHSRAITAQQIAEALHVSVRTVYRDIADLIYTGTPIHAEAGVGYMIDKEYYLPPLTFTPEELEAIGLGLSVVEHRTAAHLADHARSAASKIKVALPKPLQDALNDVKLYAMQSQMADQPSMTFLTAQKAMNGSQTLNIAYVDAKDARTQRTIHPLALISGDKVWLLAAWCEMRQDFRNFRFDRIEDITDTGHKFADHPERNLAAYQRQNPHCAGAFAPPRMIRD